MNIDKLILEAKKRGKKVNPWAVCTASVGGKIGSTERSEWTKSQKEKYERCVQDVKKKQRIKENFSINEVGGYDDPMMFAMHAGGQSGNLKSSYNALTEILNHLNNLKSEPVIDDNLKMEIESFLTGVKGPMENLSSAIINFEKKNLNNFRGGRPRPRDLDESFNFRKVILTEQQLNETLLNEGWKDVLLGIALLTGIGLSSAQAQNAKEALSKDDVKNKIEATLSNDTLLGKITKNLPINVQQKIQKNADRALDNLEKRGSKVKTTTATDKDLAQKIGQGYVPIGMETSTDTIAGKDTIITYTQDFETILDGDGLFKTGSYQLSEEGIKAIQHIKDSIQSVGGVIDSVYIESSTDREPIKMGNQKLAQLRAESVSTYFDDVNVNIKTLPDQGPDVYTTTMSKEDRVKARQETAPNRYVKIVVNATYQDTMSGRTQLPEEVIEKNYYELVKVVKKGKHKIKIEFPPIKWPKIHLKKKTKCKPGSVKCPIFGQKNYNF